ncbi:MAG: S49 family peptidase [Planctomycetota bacterium]
MPSWNEVLQEITRIRSEAQNCLDTIRRKWLRKLHEHTGRNVIAYYSGFLSRPEIPSFIEDEDKNGFMMAVHKLDRSKGLDLILHTPGGDIASTQSIVHYLRKMFGADIRAVVPQIAMSAGTMIACCCKQIIMGKQSNLGPIDPQIAGVQAYGVIAEFRRACREVKKDPDKIPIWQTIIGQYRPAFLDRCENAIKWSDQFVREQLVAAMFANDPTADQKAKAIVRKLTDYRGNRTHSRHIHLDECEQIGLKVFRLEDDPTLQDVVLTIHHCYMHVFQNTPCHKAIENHLGMALIKAARVAQPPGHANPA